jgi:ABC-type multidrug transport system fused ATPase/permease subunit
MGASNGVSTAAPKIISNIFTICFTGYYLFKDNWKLATITMAIIPIWKASSDRISARSKEAQKQAHSIKVQFASGFP